MGAFAPSPLVDAALRGADHARDRRARDRRDGGGSHPFRGFLYVGLMLTPDGPKVIEFNVRLGDPEAQVILPLIEEPLLPLLLAAARRRQLPRTVSHGSAVNAVGVVLASRGYPESSSPAGRSRHRRGRANPAFGLPRGDGAARRPLVTAGGRVLTVVGRGGTSQRRSRARTQAC